MTGNGDRIRLALFGGIYNNYLALEATLADARNRGAEGIYCLGDLGAFGPHPDRVFPLLDAYNVACVQGNYDHSIGNELDDCQCGYTDPRDNYFAAISYEYTRANTAEVHRQYLRNLPPEMRLQCGQQQLLLCHGSPRRTNEFLWQSTTPTHFLGRQAELNAADVILATHTGIKWHRELPQHRHFINVGVIGRPENDGHTNVWYTMLELDGKHRVTVDFIPIEYDYRRLAAEMQQEQLPQEFIETIVTGWWTTCLEVLPAKERRRGRH